LRNNSADRAPHPFDLAPPAWSKGKYRVGRLGLWNAVTPLIPEASHPGTVALDAGCGMRPFDRVMSELGYVPLGVDVPPSIGDVLGSVEKLPFKDSTFPLVVCVNVLAYVDDPEGSMKELFRVVRPGGTLVIVLPCFWPLDEWESWRWTPVEAERAVTYAGFTDVLVNPIGPTTSNITHILALSMRRMIPKVGWIAAGPLDAIARASLDGKNLRFPGAHALRGVRPA
jgi:SAM-dependent methyltransferase